MYGVLIQCMNKRRILAAVVVSCLLIIIIGYAKEAQIDHHIIIKVAPTSVRVTSTSDANQGDYPLNTTTDLWDETTRTEALSTTEIDTTTEAQDNFCNATHMVPIQKKRRNLLQGWCDKLNNTRPLSDAYVKKSRELLVDDARKIIFCTPSKAGSSEWRATLIATSDTFQKKNLTKKDLNHSVVHGSLGSFGIKRLMEYKLKDLKHKFDNYLKIILVRHPLERVVSSYRDRFLHGMTYSDSTIHVTKKLGKLYALPNMTYTDVKFRDLVYYITHENPVHIDCHWIPLYEECLPCAIKYDYIAKVETLSQDNPCILEAIMGEEANDSYFFPPGQNGPSSLTGKYRANTDKIYSKFLRNLSNSELDELKEVYRRDCDMFGYDCNLYDKE